MGEAQASDLITDPRLFVRSLAVRIISALSDAGVATGPLIVRLSGAASFAAFASNRELDTLSLFCRAVPSVLTQRLLTLMNGFPCFQVSDPLMVPVIHSVNETIQVIPDAGFLVVVMTLDELSPNPA